MEILYWILLEKDLLIENEAMKSFKIHIYVGGLSAKQ